MGKPARLGWSDFQLALILIVTALPVLLLSFYLYKRSIDAEHRLIRLDTEIMAQSMGRYIRAFAKHRVLALKLTAAFYESSEDVDDAEFITFSEQLQQGFPELCCLSFIDDKGGLQRVYPKQDKAKAIAQLQASGLMPSVREVLASGRLRIVSKSPLLCYRSGVTVLHPVFKNGKISGVVLGSIPVPEGVEKVFGEQVLQYWRFAILDPRGMILYSSPEDENPRSGHWQWQKEIWDEREPAVVDFPFGDETWQLVVWPKSSLHEVLHTSAPERILLCGALTTVLIICGVSILFWRQRALTQALEDARRAHDIVKASEQRFHDMMERVHLLGLVIDPTAKIRFCNARFVQASGYSREELIGRDAIELLVPPQERPKFRKLRRDVLSGVVQEISGQMNLMTRDGKTRQIAWNHVISRDAYGKVELVISLGDDITDRLAQEESQRQTQKLESLGVLAGGIAHDFNNLLTTIIGHNDMAMRKAGPGSPIKVHLDNVGRTARRLADLTSQMLAYSGRGRFEVREVDMNQLVEEMADLLRISIPKRVEIRYDLQDGLPTVEVDATQIEQVLLNLVTNASEAIQNRSGWILLKTRMRRVSVEEAEGLIGGQKVAPGTFVELSVQDNGCGMDEKTLDRIFDPFFTTKFTGRGLGLAVLLGIVRGHGGAVTVDSQPGIGTTFHVIIPLKRSDVSHETDVADGTSGAKALAVPTPENLGPMEQYDGGGTVLIIDDEETIRTLAADVLDSAGFHVLQAPDGETGLELLKKHRQEIVVVLLDLTMPGMGGEATFARCGAIAPEVRVVMTSGYSNMEIEWQFHGQNLAGFVHKPFLPQELAAKIIYVANLARSGKAS